MFCTLQTNAQITALRIINDSETEAQSDSGACPVTVAQMLVYTFNSGRPVCV